MQSSIKKHSVIVGGRKTSISLEHEFWGALQEIAEEMHLSISAVVEQIDANRNSVNLSSAIRVFVFKYYRVPVALRGGDATTSLLPSKV